MARALITVPPRVRRGEPFEIRVLIAHPMETGYRSGADGQRLPRDILRRVSCHHRGELVMEADLFPAVAANPYLAFSAVVDASGPLVFRWEGDHGFSQVETVELEVT